MTDREPDGRSLNFAGDVDEQGRSDAGFLAERRRSGRRFHADIEALHLCPVPGHMRYETPSDLRCLDLAVDRWPVCCH